MRVDGSVNTVNLAISCGVAVGILTLGKFWGEWGAIFLSLLLSIFVFWVIVKNENDFSEKLLPSILGGCLSAFTMLVLVALGM